MFGISQYVNGPNTPLMKNDNGAPSKPYNASLLEPVNAAEIYMSQKMSIIIQKMFSTDRKWTGITWDDRL